MLEKPEILFEGTYSYQEKGQKYATEHFKMLSSSNRQAYQLHAEVLARNDMGEFLKVITRLDLNQQLHPVGLEIEKFLGKNYSFEIFRADSQESKLTYTFRDSTGEQVFRRPFSSKIYLTSRAISASTLFTLTKRWDVSGRTAVTMLTSGNNWKYETPPVESTISAEFKVSEPMKVSVNLREHAATPLLVYSEDSADPANFLVSRTFGIPFRVTSDTRIHILEAFETRIQSLK